VAKVRLHGRIAIGAHGWIQLAHRRTITPEGALVGGVELTLAAAASVKAKMPPLGIISCKPAAKLLDLPDFNFIRQLLGLGLCLRLFCCWALIVSWTIALFFDTISFYFISAPLSPILDQSPHECILYMRGLLTHNHSNLPI
jgi:hypothetical protein